MPISNCLSACRAALLLATLAACGAQSAAAQSAATEGLALCLLQGLDPNRDNPYFVNGAYQMSTDSAVNDFLASRHLNVKPTFDHDVKEWGGFRAAMSFMALSEENYPDGKYWKSIDNGGVFLFDKDIRDRGDGGVYGDSLAGHSTKPAAYKCELIREMKVCGLRASSRAYFVPCAE